MLFTFLIKVYEHSRVIGESYSKPLFLIVVFEIKYIIGMIKINFYS